MSQVQHRCPKCRSFDVDKCHSIICPMRPAETPDEWINQRAMDMPRIQKRDGSIVAMVSMDDAIVYAFKMNDNAIQRIMELEKLLNEKAQKDWRSEE